MTLRASDYFCTIHNVRVTVRHLKEYHKDAFYREFDKVLEQYMDILEDESALNTIESARYGIFVYDMERD